MLLVILRSYASTQLPLRKLRMSSTRGNLAIGPRGSSILSNHAWHLFVRFSSGNMTSTNTSVINAPYHLGTPNSGSTIQIVLVKCVLANTNGLRESMMYSHVYRLLKYSVGGKIHPHTDHDAFGYGSVTFNLNQEYTGGVFKFFNGQHSVHLKRGEMMIWPADYFWVHEVTPIKSGVRYSTNSFLLSIPVEVRDEICANTKEYTNKWFEHHCKEKPEPYTINHK